MRDVFACYLTDGVSVSHSFHRSLIQLMAHDKRIIEGGPRSRRTGPGDLANGRNELTAYWLDHSGVEWMWMIDSDMGFQATVLDQLMESATPLVEQDGSAMVGALCFSWRADEPDGFGGYLAHATPTIFHWRGSGFGVATQYPPDTLHPVDGTGAACLLIHRNIAEEVRDVYGDDWWTPVRYPTGAFLGEDLSFSYRVRSVNRAIYVDTSIKTTHAKTAWIGEGNFRGIESS